MARSSVVNEFVATRNLKNFCESLSQMPSVYLTLVSCIHYNIRKIRVPVRYKYKKVQ
jgi:nucleoside permease NupC